MSTFLGSTSSRISSTLQAVRGHRDQQQRAVSISPSPPVTLSSCDDDGSGQKHEEVEDFRTKARNTLPTLLPTQKLDSLARVFDRSTHADPDSTIDDLKHNSQSQLQQAEDANAYLKHAKTLSSSSASYLSGRHGLHSHAKDAATRTVTHGTPFAPHPFTGADGAPGFEGLNRNWNEHGFEFDEDAMLTRGRGITLIGRMEITVPVLTDELANLVGKPKITSPTSSTSYCFWHPCLLNNLLNCFCFFFSISAFNNSLIFFRSVLTFHPYPAFRLHGLYCTVSTSMEYRSKRCIPSVRHTTEQLSLLSETRLAMNLVFVSAREYICPRVPRTTEVVIRTLT